MLKLLAGTALGFAAAWFTDSNEGESRRAMVMQKIDALAGKLREQAQGAADDEAQSISEVDTTAAPGVETTTSGLETSTPSG